LAIELAATRVKVLTVEQIAARLDDRFRLLTGGSRTSLPRHQTLRAAMDWSYELLSPPERTMLRRLAIFADGWTLEAAENVCSGRPITREQVLDLLTQLADKSLVIVEADRDEARYRLAETVRQYALDRLLESREAARLRRRHRDWYLALAERAEGTVWGPEDTDWFKRLEVEHDNLRSALAWSLEERDGAEVALRLAAALGQFWHVHSHYTEGRQWLARVLARSSGTVSQARGNALVRASILAWRQGDHAEATTLTEEALTVFAEVRDTFGLGLAHMQQGLIDIREDNFAAATARFEEALTLARQSGQKALIALVLAQLAAVARYEGNFDRAWALCEESTTLFRELRTKGQIAYVVRLAGHVARGRADLPRAVDLYKESLRLYHEVGNKWVASECLEGLAMVAALLQDHDRAARLFAKADAVRDTLGLPLAPPERHAHAKHRDIVRAALGDGAFVAACAEGRAMTLDEAIEYALQDAK
jgi:non-specific serine/threonine protein kinase